MNMTVKILKQAIKDLPDDALVCHHGWDKGCCLTSYQMEETWCFPKDKTPVQAFVMNPGENYDPRKPKDLKVTAS